MESNKGLSTGIKFFGIYLILIAPVWTLVENSPCVSKLIIDPIHHSFQKLSPSFNPSVLQVTFNTRKKDIT